MAQVIIPELQNLNIASLYVGDLKSDVTEQTLWNAFSPYGQVLSVRVCRNSQTQASLGYGYVNYRTPMEAEKAMKSVNFTLIEGRPCRVMWSMRDPSKRKAGIGNLFIKNIDPVLDTRSLYEAFSSFGPVMSCKIAIDEYGVSKGYGFIQFYNERDAEEARRRSDGVPFMKKKIVVTKFVPRSARVDAKVVNPAEFTNIFVKNFGKDFTLDDLKTFFGKFGEITSCVIQVDEETKESLGYGFVNFALPECALEAVTQSNGYLLPNELKLYVCRAMKKLERVAFLKKQHEDRKKEVHRLHLNMNLYVKNFEESVDEEKLAKMFEPYGKLTSVRLMTDENGKSKNFGFVCFSNLEDAKAALDDMNGKVIDTKPLYVAIAQNKEERRRMLELRAYENNFRVPPMFGGGPVPTIVYPQPGALAYPPVQYTRFPHNIRPQRAIGQGNMNSNQQNYGNQQQRGGGYNSYHGNPNHYRNRGASNAHAQQSNRQGNYNNQRNYNHQQQAQGVVNTVATEQITKTPKENTKSQKPVHQDIRTVNSEKIYSIAKGVFGEKNYDMAHLQKVTGILIDYYTDNSSNIDNAEIIGAVSTVYKDHISSLGVSGTQ